MIYTTTELKRVKKHPQFETLMQNLRFISQWTEAYALTRPLQAILYSAQLEWGVGENPLGDKLQACLNALPAWLATQAEHNITFWNIPDICRAASLSENTRGELASLMQELLTRLELPANHPNSLLPVNMCTGLRARDWLRLCLGHSDDSINDYGSVPRQWGLSRILNEAYEENGMQKFDGTDIRYCFIVSRPCLVAVAERYKTLFDTASFARYKAAYNFPIQLLSAGGLHPIIGDERKNTLTRGLYLGLNLRDWPGTDAGSKWARAKMRSFADYKLQFEDLMVPSDIGYVMPERPNAGMVSMDIPRLVKKDYKDHTHFIHFGDSLEAPTFGGGHTTDYPLPAEEIIWQNGLREFKTRSIT